MNKCQWTPYDDEAAYDTACDNLFQFFDGGPKENRFTFCPYCGGEIIVTDLVPVEDEGMNTEPNKC